MESSPEKSLLMKAESQNAAEVTEAEKEAALKSMRETNFLSDEDGSNFTEELFAKLLGFGDDSNKGKVTFTPREVAKIKRLAHAYMTDATEPEIKKKVRSKVEEDLLPYDPTERAVVNRSTEDPSDTRNDLVMKNFNVGTIHDEETKPKIEFKVAAPKKRIVRKERSADAPPIPIDKRRAPVKKTGPVLAEAPSSEAGMDLQGLSDEQKIATLRFFIQRDGDATGAYQKRLDALQGKDEQLPRAA